MSEVYVRLEAGRGIISVSEPFDADYVSVYDAAFRHYSGLFNALFPAEIYGNLANLGGTNLTRETGE